MKKFSVIAMIVLISVSIDVSGGFAELLFFDRFEYVVNRDNSTLPGNDSSNALLLRVGGRIPKPIILQVEIWSSLYNKFNSRILRRDAGS